MADRIRIDGLTQRQFNLRQLHDKENVEPTIAIDAVKDEPKRFEEAAEIKSPPQAPLFDTMNNVSLSTVAASEGSPTESRTSSKSDWISPDKSNEAEMKTPPRDNKSPREGVTSEAEAYDASFEVASEAEQPSPELMITGSRLKTLALEDEDFDFKTAIPPLDLSVISDPELQINASGKDWIKIQHGGQEKLIMLPAAGGSLELGTFEIAETLAATFDITDDVEIVGLTSAVVLSEDESNKFKHHGEAVIPLSFVASGQLKAIIEAGNDTIPAFSLVTKKLCHFEHQGGHGLDKFGLDGELDVESLGMTSASDVSFGEEREYTDAFIDLMENSDEFTAVEKNILLKLGIDEAMSGNVLFRAAFRLA